MPRREFGQLVCPCRWPDIEGFTVASKAVQACRESSARGFKGEVAMSRLVLIGQRSAWRCGVRKLEDVGHRCNDLNTSAAVGEYGMKQADAVDSVLT